MMGFIGFSNAVSHLHLPKIANLGEAAGKIASQGKEFTRALADDVTGVKYFRQLNETIENATVHGNGHGHGHGHGHGVKEAVEEASHNVHKAHEVPQVAGELVDRAEVGVHTLTGLTDKGLHYGEKLVEGGRSIFERGVHFGSDTAHTAVQAIQNVGHNAGTAFHGAVNNAEHFAQIAGNNIDRVLDIAGHGAVNGFDHVLNNVHHWVGGLEHSGGIVSNLAVNTLPSILHAQKMATALHGANMPWRDIGQSFLTWH